MVALEWTERASASRNGDDGDDGDCCGTSSASGFDSNSRSDAKDLDLDILRLLLLYLTLFDFFVLPFFLRRMLFGDADLCLDFFLFLPLKSFKSDSFEAS